MTAAVRLRPIDKARPTMTATAIVDNLNLPGLKEEFLNHRRIAQDRLKRLHGRLTARIHLFAGQFLAVDYLKPRKSGIETLTVVLKHGMTQNLNVVRCMFALGAMLRTSPLSRRSFFAADGAAFIVQALADDAPSRVRVRALVIAADVFENPTVHVTGANSQTLATGERHLAIKGVEAFARLMRRGSRDSREKVRCLF